MVSIAVIGDCNLRAGDLFGSDVTGNAHVITADTNRQSNVVMFRSRKASVRSYERIAA